MHLKGAGYRLKQLSSNAWATDNEVALSTGTISGSPMMVSMHVRALNEY